MSFEVDIGFASERGLRSANEDFGHAVLAPTGTGSHGLIAAIADGVSDGGRGREAAQTTVLGLVADFFAAPDTWETTVVLDRLISAQNGWLADHNKRRQGPGQDGGAGLTTLTALALQGQTWTLAHVGDTRAWRLRVDPASSDDDAGLQLLTTDHALDQADLRSRLTRAVGLDSQIRVDYMQGEICIGDCFVLTSDGVHAVLKPAQISAALDAADAQSASEALVLGALRAGSTDNATALVVRVRGIDVRRLDDEIAAGRRLAPPAVLKVGDVLDGYAITARIADSGVNLLYQARDLAHGDLVALKTLHPARAGDAEERAMLAHEAWLGARMEGRGFVRVRDRRPDASALFTVFDWHHGRTLEQMLRDDPPPAVADVVATARAIVEALARLHRLGVVHRDIKPANLHLGDDGQWRILDLGVAVSGREGAAQRELHAGTPSFMNPEQWSGESADAASDLFALGVTLYRWLVGRLPYGEIEPWQLGRYRRDPASPSRARPDVPMWLDHLLLKAVALDRRLRFETAEEFSLALERGASRLVDAMPPTPLMRRDPTVLLKGALAVSLVFNVLLVVWLLFLPH